MGKKVKASLCRDCVNFLELVRGTAECDYSSFDNVYVEEAELFTADMFGCSRYEEIPEDEPLACEDCVNLLELTAGSLECDYEYFEGVSAGSAEGLTPLLFGCKRFEKIQ
jgi:hypothetical protein